MQALMMTWVSRCWLRTYFGVGALALVFSTALAVAAPNRTAEAKRHFERGVELALKEAYQPAAAEFQQAYELSPHYAVLFNLAQAYIALGRPVEAVSVLERYLKEAPPSAASSRLQEAKLALELQRAEIGRLQVVVEPAGAEVRVDGVKIETQGLQKPLELARGNHEVSVGSTGYKPQTLSVGLAGGESKRVSIKLELSSSALQVVCPRAGVRVSVDNRHLGVTPFSAPIPVSVGPHQVSFAEEAGSLGTFPVVVGADALATVQCLNFKPATGGLSVTTRPAGASLRVDGKPFAGAPLPAGRHRLEVRKFGYQPWSRTFEIRAGVTQPLLAALTPEASKSSNLRTWSYVLGAAGLVTGGIGLGLFVDNEARYADYLDDVDQLKADFGRTQASDTNALAKLRARESETNRRAASIQTQQALAGGFALGSVVLLVAGGVVWLEGGGTTSEPTFSAVLSPRGGGLVQWTEQW